jgi:hypothetical protein
MWNREVEVPSGNLNVKDVLDILISALTRDEMRELASELSSCADNCEDVLEPCDFDMDV